MSESHFTYTLAQLQGMTTEQLQQAFPQKRYTWIRKGYKVNITDLIKAIILATKHERWTVSEERGVREFWYNPVKPILLKAEPNRDPEHYMRLTESILAHMVKDKRNDLTYANLGILEFRTMKELYEDSLDANCWKTTLLFVEKDSAYVHLKPLRKLFNITIISGGGWAKAAGIEKTLMELKAKGVQDVEVDTLTDYDPFGFAIETEFIRSCEDIGFNVTGHHRIGIKPKHATSEILTVQRYPIKHGRKLTVKVDGEAISFDADKWLEECGIAEDGTIGHGDYGLEIEAISGQPGGHAYLRKIVAIELLNHLHEQDRIKEFTQKAWEKVPFTALTNLMYAIDQNDVEQKDLEEPPKPEDIPKQFLKVQQYHNLAQPIIDEREEATEDIESEISDLEDQLEDLRAQKEEAEQPFNDQINVLASRYLKSRRLIAYHLWQYYQEHKNQWPRENYSLGFPEGCMLTNLEKENGARTMQQQLDTREPIEHITKTFKDVLSNGELETRIASYTQGLSDKMRTENKCDKDEQENPDNEET